MGKYEKPILKILSGQSDTNIPFDDLCNLAWWWAIRCTISRWGSVLLPIPVPLPGETTPGTNFSFNPTFVVDSFTEIVSLLNLV